MKNKGYYKLLLIGLVLSTLSCQQEIDIALTETTQSTIEFFGEDPLVQNAIQENITLLTAPESPLANRQQLGITSEEQINWEQEHKLYGFENVEEVQVFYQEYLGLWNYVLETYDMDTFSNEPKIPELGELEERFIFLLYIMYRS